MDATYTAVATSSGRDARAVTADGQLDVQLALPKELGGTGDGLNPEQLLAAGWAACFSTVLDRLGQARNLDAKDIAVTAEVSLMPQASRFTLAAVLHVELPHHLDNPAGHRLVEAAHTICPYSTATAGNVPVQIVLE
ncbi:Ohr family peroxiredoxin [Kribbella sp. NPDC048915]|uniref:Ohr family peroxiredoxin n=1 Tax=Kribbella sp. NPDC048915 TaxID=3155148 RepID=UPI003405485A